MALEHSLEPELVEPEPTTRPLYGNPYRNWNSAKGNHTTSARLLDYTDSAVRLMKDTGTLITVRTASLSPIDGLYVEEQDKKLIDGVIYSVYDADTIIVKSDETQYRVRLNGIDAPERLQDFGRKATAALRDKVLNKHVRVRWDKQDKYKRYLGDVFLRGEWVNLQLVKDGWAWHYLKYSDDPDLGKAELEAREAKRGLWSDSSEPEPPWVFRDLREVRRQKLREKRESELLAGSKRQQRPKSTFGLQPAPKPVLDHWLNTSTGVRHNSGCRHYGKTKSGRPCSGIEGKACGQCGG